MLQLGATGNAPTCYVGKRLITAAESRDTLPPPAPRCGAMYRRPAADK